MRNNTTEKNFIAQRPRLAHTWGEIQISNFPNTKLDDAEDENN